MATETRFELTIRKEAAATKAQDAFWAEIAKSFPEIKTGDFTPDQQLAFDKAIRAAVNQWVENNKR